MSINPCSFSTTDSTIPVIIFLPSVTISEIILGIRPVNIFFIPVHIEPFGCGSPSAPSVLANKFLNDVTNAVIFAGIATVNTSFKSFQRAPPANVIPSLKSFTTCFTFIGMS